jgi:PAS domain S-box-containing protein
MRSNDNIATAAAVTSSTTRGGMPSGQTDLLERLHEKEALLATADRLGHMRNWTYDVASGVLHWTSQTGDELPVPAGSRDDFTLAAFLDGVRPADRPRLLRTAHEALLRPMPFSFRYSRVDTRGAERTFEVQAESQVNAANKVCHIVGTVMETTQLEQQREANEAVTARLKVMDECTTVWWWEQDEQLRFTYVTNADDPQYAVWHESAVGQRRWEIPGCTPCKGGWAEHIEVLRAHQPFHDFQYQMGVDAEATYFSSTGVPVFSEDGRFTGYRGTAHDITALKRAEQKARQIETLLGIASQLAKLGAWMIDIPARSPTWSPEFLSILDLDACATPTIDDLMDLVPAHWRDLFANAIEGCASRAEPIDIEFETLTPKGRRIWLHLIGTAKRDSCGKVVRLKGAAQDITERKRESERSRVLSQELTTTLESMTDAFIIVDKELRFRYVNAEMEKLTGQTRQSLLGRNITEALPGFSSPRAREALARAVAAGGKTDTVEAYSEVVGKWFQVTGYPSSQGLALVLRDISESKKARDALLESEERHRLLFESSSDGILRKDLSGRIHQANPAACAMFGRTEEKLRAVNSFDLVSPTHRDVLQSMVLERRRTGRASGELRMVRSDGSEFEAEVTVSEYQHLDGARYINLVFRDATERIRLRRARDRLNDDLARMVRERTAELERTNSDLKGFAHALAHDLRQPLSVIKSFCFALNSAVDDNNAAKSKLFSGRIEAAAALADDYVQALLSLAKTSHGPLTVSDVNLSAMAQDIVEELQQRDETRKVGYKIQQELHTQGDARLLRMLLQNLLGNAWKFTSRRDVAELSLAAQLLEGEVVYTLQDNGAGFDMAHADQLFGTFKRLHKETEFPGIGVGLANSQRIVLRHGGRIWAESVAGEGASFHFTLPGLPSTPT